MSVMEARLGGRRVAARNAAERRKKIILASLIVLFVALMAFQLPKLLKGSESSTHRPGGGLGGPGYGRRRLGSCGRLGARALIGARSRHQADVRQGSVRAADPRERGHGVRGPRYF